MKQAAAFVMAALAATPAGALNEDQAGSMWTVGALYAVSKMCPEYRVDVGSLDTKLRQFIAVNRISPESQELKEGIGQGVLAFQESVATYGTSPACKTIYGIVQQHEQMRGLMTVAPAPASPTARALQGEFPSKEQRGEFPDRSKRGPHGTNLGDVVNGRIFGCKETFPTLSTLHMPGCY